MLPVLLLFIMVLEVHLFSIGEEEKGNPTQHNSVHMRTSSLETTDKFMIVVGVMIFREAGIKAREC